MKFKVSATVELDSEIDPENLQKILHPENSTEDDTIITSEVQHNQVVTQIQGTMSMGTLLRTIDDILQTATLVNNVADTTD